MKKIIVGVLISILSFGLFLVPHSDTIAEEVTQVTPNIKTYHTYECDQYVDLNNVETFTTDGTSMYYSKLSHTEGLTNYYTVYAYNMDTNATIEIISNVNALRNVSSMQYSNGYLYVGYDHNSYLLIDTNTLNNTTYSTITLNNFTNEPFRIFYDGEKYVTATIETQGTTPSTNILKVTYFTDIADPTTIIGETKTFDLSAISGNIDTTSSITIGKNKIYIVKDNTLYPFNYDTTGISVSSPITKPLFADIQSSSIYSIDTKNYFVYSRTEAIYFYDPDTDEEKVKSFDGSGYADNKIYINEDNLYFYNNTDCDIRKYEIAVGDEKPLNSELVLVKGKGSEVGRFDDVNDFTLKCNDYVFVSDKNNHRIQVLKNNQPTHIIDLKEESTEYFAKSLMLAKDNTLYYIKTDGIVSKLCGINIFTNTSIEPIGISSHISDACICDNGIIYMLETDNKKIISIDTKNNFTQGQYNLSGITLDSFSLIQNLDQYLFISSGNKLYKYSTNTFILDPTPIEFENDITSFSCPINQLIYVVCEGENKIHKVCFEDDVIESTDDVEVEWNAGQEVSIIRVNPQDGSIYGFDKKTSSFVYFKEDIFCYGYDTVEPFQKYVLTSLNGYTDVVKFGVLKANNFVYEYINYVGNHDLFSSDKNVVILDTKKNTSQFTYILYVVGNEVKLGYVETSAIETYTVETDNNKFSLITTDANSPIYKFPTIKGNLEVESVENIGTVLTADGVYPISIDGLDTQYYIVRLINNTYGYVPSTYVTQNVNISEKFSSNATVKIYDYSTFVNVYSNVEKEEIIGALSNDQRIYVDNYDKEAEFTMVRYLDGDNKIRAGYVDTKYITMDGGSPLITTAIILFAITFVIIIALVIWYITFKRKHSQDTMREKDQQSKEISKSKKVKSLKIKDTAKDNKNSIDDNKNDESSEEE